MWTVADLDIKLCEKIIPAFEAVHGAGYQALIMVDNSQGHCAAVPLRRTLFSYLV